MTALKMEWRKLGDLTHYAANNKTHPPDQVASIAASIRRFGFNDPIGIDEAGVIVEGHGRALAAKLLGMEEVPVIVLPATMTSEEIDLYRIAHNRLSLSSTFDFAKLVEELKIISADMENFSDMGFSAAAMRNLFQMFGEGSVPNQSHGGDQEINDGSGLDFEVIWETTDQRKQWDAFAKKASATHKEASDAGALVAVLTMARAGTLIPATLEETNVATEDLEW